MCAVDGMFFESGHVLSTKTRRVVSQMGRMHMGVWLQSERNMIVVKAYVSGIAIDCPDSAALSAFYGALLDIEPVNEGLVIARGDEGDLEVWFQQVENYAAPTWPTQERGQQIHFDITVSDMDAAQEKAISLGAKLVDDGQDSFHVFLDPAGHPFCLCRESTGE